MEQKTSKFISMDNNLEKSLDVFFTTRLKFEPQCIIFLEAYKNLKEKSRNKPRDFFGIESFFPRGCNEFLSEGILS